MLSVFGNVDLDVDRRLETETYFEHRMVVTVFLLTNLAQIITLTYNTLESTAANGINVADIASCIMRKKIVFNQLISYRLFDFLLK
jgi:hypothetical protein